MAVDWGAIGLNQLIRICEHFHHMFPTDLQVVVKLSPGTSRLLRKAALLPETVHGPGQVFWLRPGDQP